MSSGPRDVRKLLRLETLRLDKDTFALGGENEPIGSLTCAIGLWVVDRSEVSFRSDILESKCVLLSTVTSRSTPKYHMMFFQKNLTTLATEIVVMGSASTHLDKYSIAMSV